MGNTKKALCKNTLLLDISAKKTKTSPEKCILLNIFVNTQTCHTKSKSSSSIAGNENEACKYASITNDAGVPIPINHLQQHALLSPEKRCLRYQATTFTEKPLSVNYLTPLSVPMALFYCLNAFIRCKIGKHNTHTFIICKRSRNIKYHSSVHYIGTNSHTPKKGTFHTIYVIRRANKTFFAYEYYIFVQMSIFSWINENSFCAKKLPYVTFHYCIVFICAYIVKITEESTLKNMAALSKRYITSFHPYYTAHGYDSRDFFAAHLQPIGTTDKEKNSKN